MKHGGNPFLIVYKKRNKQNNHTKKFPPHPHQFTLNGQSRVILDFVHFGLILIQMSEDILDNA